MFRLFAQFLGSTATGQVQQIIQGAPLLFQMHPAELTALLEHTWTIVPLQGSTVPRLQASPFSPPFNKVSSEATLIETGLKSLGGSKFPAYHLIYAYMIANTRVLDVFKYAVKKLVHGEELGTPSAITQHWLRNTEELFFKDQPPFWITSLTSYLRQDREADFRRAFYTMFGMDLNHGMEDGKPYPYYKATAANTSFVSAFTEFLRDVRTGITHANNLTGANPTDIGKINDELSRLSVMLTSRREGNNLWREEFVYVSLMDWFHLTLMFDSSIVTDLKADGQSEEQRLFKIAERVKLPAHGKARAFFKMADPLARILRGIEDRIFTDPIKDFFPPSTAISTQRQKDSQADIREIITQWSEATNQNLNAAAVVAS
jgi:hypothetical protein